MEDYELKRKLAAILSADVAEYSRLMSADEEATVIQLTRYREELSRLVSEHNGRVIDAPGDNLLAEFDSVVDSLRCGWAAQNHVADLNERLPEDRRMQFRIGINLGDIIEREGKLYGDGVNVAARLEGLAEPGGIAVSGTAYDQVKRKVPYGFHFVGEQRVKNIADPVRVYRVEPNPTRETESQYGGGGGQGLRKSTLAFLLVAGIILLAGGYYAYKNLGTDVSRHPPSAAAPAANYQLNRGASIAVLPFENLSSDIEQEYFSDGITNDIITDLSRFSELIVIASNTMFTYKGKALQVTEIGKQLDVQYILEGSVQKTGDKVRINAQLIDSSDGTHIWAERYSREYSDIFELQAEIVSSIVAALAVNVSQSERDRAMRKAPQDLSAYDYLLRGWTHYQHRTRGSSVLAQEMFSKARDIDPQYAAAYTGLGLVEYAKVSYGWTEFPTQALERAFEYGQKALTLDPNNAAAHSLLCNVYTFQNKYELAIHEAERALALNPNDALTYAQMGWVLLWAGRIDEAITALEMSLRLDYSSSRNAWLHLGMAYYLQGRYDQAAETLEKGLVKRPGFVGYYIALAAAYAQLERPEDAASAADNVRRLDPFFEVESFGTAFRNPSHRQAIAAGLRRAGLQ